MRLYGTMAEVRLRKHTNDRAGTLQAFKEVILNLHGARMKIVERPSNADWAIIGSTARPEEDQEMNHTGKVRWSRMNKSAQQPYRHRVWTKDWTGISDISK
jgi:hypothetical protein